MHKLKNLYGTAYNCSTSNDKYCKDWYTLEYKNIYDNKNYIKSLHNVKILGFNHIRTYYLNPDYDHSDFLSLCSKLKLSIEIAISNDLIETLNIEKIKKLVDNVKSYNCVTIYTIGNEYFGDINKIIKVINIVLSRDNTRYIMHSSIFDNNFKLAKSIYNQIPENIKNKYIVGINMYFYNNSDISHGDVIQEVINNYYNDDILKNSYLIVSEFGNNKDSFDSLWNFSFGNIECLKKYPKYLGYSLFSYSDESWKGGYNHENNYGIITEKGDKKNSYIAIDQFKNTLEFNNIKKQLY